MDGWMDRWGCKKTYQMFIISCDYNGGVGGGGRVRKVNKGKKYNGGVK